MVYAVRLHHYIIWLIQISSHLQFVGPLFYSAKIRDTYSKYADIQYLPTYAVLSCMQGRM